MINYAQAEVWQQKAKSVLQKRIKSDTNFNIFITNLMEIITQLPCMPVSPFFKQFYLKTNLNYKTAIKPNNHANTIVSKSISDVTRNS